MVIIHLMIIYDYDDSNDDGAAAAAAANDDDVYKRDDNYHYSLISYMHFHRLSISST